MTTMPVSFDEALLDRLRARAAELKLSVSNLLVVAAEEYLDRHSDEPWADPLDEEERAVLRGMRRKYRDTLKDPW
jgi:L-lysine 2,3-aminomutase